MIATATRAKVAQTISVAAISVFLFILPSSRRRQSPRGRIDSRRAIYEAVFRVALKRRGIERAEVSSAVHEPNGGHRRGKVQEARQPVRRCDQTPRVGAISEHVLSPSVWASAHGSIGRCLRAEDVTAWIAAL